MTKEELLQTYFYIEDISGSENTLQIFKSTNNTTTITVYYTTTPDDSSSWLNIETSTTPTSITLSPNSKIYLKCTANTWCYATGNSNRINCSNNYNVGGNIMSLLYGDEFIDKINFKSNTYCHFYQLFQNSTTLVNAKNLQLPATTLAQNCYYSMFNDCSSLTTAPELPATTLAQNCYYSMFKNCSSLTTAPELPATTLTNQCYYMMFCGCTSLTTAPELPATTLTNQCYYMMFYGCTSLTTAPELPATTLADKCYQSMFYYCTSLTTAPSELPATTLAQNCYYSMFNDCSSLTTAPELPATTLAQNCYYSMFKNCSSLTTAPELPATTLDNYCYSNMFNGCTALTKAPTILPATTLANYCYDSMFSGCSSLTTTPELPATTLATGCYQNTFYYCTSLTTAPELPATTLVDNCYTQMFSKCYKLNYIKADFIEYSNDNNEFTDWVRNVSNTGTFVMNPDANYNPEEIRGVNGIPTGWNAKSSIGVTFINIDSSKTNYLTINKLEGLYSNIELTYSTNYIDWVAIEDLSQPIEFKKQLSLRGINNSLEGYSFSCTETYSVNGNIMELLLGEEADNLGNVFPENTEFNFKSLFKNSDNLVDISKLKLTSGDLVKGCYEQMFCGCKNLKTAPTLPSLNLSKLCYSHMFTGCKNMEVAPVLPAIELQPYCYHGMFMGCHKLNTIEANFLNYSNNNHEFDDWMLNVNKQGKFIINSESTYDVETIRGVDGIPLNWEVLSNDSTEI